MILLNIYVFKPNGVCDWIIPIVREDQTYYYNPAGRKWPKSIIDSNKEYRGGYYFSSEELKDKFCDIYYKEN